MNLNAKRKRSDDAGDIAALLTSARVSVCVFDLDSTLWNGNCEDFGTAHLMGPAEVALPSGRTLRLFPDVLAICAQLEATAESSERARE